MYCPIWELVREISEHDRIVSPGWSAVYVHRNDQMYFLIDMYLNAGETTQNLFAISIRDCSCSIVDTPISFLYGGQGVARLGNY